MTAIAMPPFRKAPLYWLALGAFAIGTEGFMIAAILPKISKDLSVDVGTAGQLVTIFALAYGLSSPILTALTGSVGRRKLLIFSMVAFCLANLIAAAAPGYWSLVGARILLAFFAGLYVPGANALAGAIVPPERRGRAIAIVNGGITVAITLGVPLGAVIGQAWGWRMTFVGVAILAAIATLGLATGLPKGVGAGLSTASLRDRIAVARRPGVLPALLVTTLWAIGAYTVYTYISPLMTRLIAVEGPRIGAILFLWGAAAAGGLVLGGIGTDRIGSRRVIVIGLFLAAAALTSLSVSSYFLTPQTALVPVIAAVVVWGASHWGFWPAQQAGLIGITGLKAASVVLSLNASFMYLGFSIGAALGSLTLAKASVGDLGWVGGASIFASLGLFLIVRGRRPAAAAPDMDMPGGPGAAGECPMEPSGLAAE